MSHLDRDRRMYAAMRPRVLDREVAVLAAELEEAVPGTPAWWVIRQQFDAVWAEIRRRGGGLEVVPLPGGR